MVTRRAIPEEVSARLFVACARKCCICHKPKQLQIHHIDENPSNNRVDNLVALCVACHGRVSGDEGFGRRYSATEVREHKREWESAVARRLGKATAAADEDEEEEGEVLHQERRRFVVRSDDHTAFEMQVEEGQFLGVAIKSDEPVNVFIANVRNFRKWENDQEARPLAADDEVLEVAIGMAANRTDRFVICVENEGDDDARVRLDIEVLSRAPDDD